MIIPAIDLIGGRCVRLSQGDYDKTTHYDASPLEMVQTYVGLGYRRIHMVDLDGAKAARPLNLDVLRAAAAVDGAEIEWGGGIKTREALDAVFDAGARYAVVGSVAAKQPALFAEWLDRFGPGRMVLGADVRGERIAVSGWLEETAQTIDSLIDLFTPYGLTQVICTDISRDGMLAGPNEELYVRLQQKYPGIAFTVSGGVSSWSDIHSLEARGLSRVIVGKAIYEGKIKLTAPC